MLSRFVFIAVFISFSRLVIPIKKILLSEEALTVPIPTLSDRQFVVAHSSLSQSDQRTQRELFWYREELFKSVIGRWHEVRSFAIPELQDLFADITTRLAERDQGNSLSETKG